MKFSPASPPLLAALWAVLIAFSTTALHSQGVVSGGINGVVRDAGGAPLAGVKITATHEPTGTVSNTTSRADGRYSFRGLPAGGPFEVVAVAPDGKKATESGVFTQVAQDIDVTLTIGASSQIVKMDALKVSASSELDASVAGAGSVLSSSEILGLASVTRSFAEMTRTNPLVTLQNSVNNQPMISAAGQPARFNSIQLDGAKINDQYGLSLSGLNSQNNPISIETIEQLNVSTSPYDVRQSGFTGASINAVTKSGTNRFSGSLYTLYVDQDMMGKDVAGPSTGVRPPREQKTYGFSFGGPLLPNRLFFFLNHEKYRVDTAPSQPGFVPDSGPLATIATRLNALALQGGARPDFGTFASTTPTIQSDDKWLYKLDWHIVPGHRIAARYSTTDGILPLNANYGQTTRFTGLAPALLTAPRGTALSGSTYVGANREKVLAVQSFNDWSERFKTEAQYSRTKFDLTNNPNVTFPEIRIFGVSGTGPNGPISNGVLFLGTDGARQGNGLESDVRSWSARGDYFVDRFTISGGVDQENSRFGNLFRNGSYGQFDYASIAAFQADTPSAFNRALVVQGTPIVERSEFTVTGVYLQGKWDINSRLWVTVGVRRDEFSTPTRTINNPQIQTIYGVRNDGTIDGTSSFSPRISFNYAVDSARMVQVRGGVGRFQGRAPWVFINNTIANSGIGRFNLTTVPTGGLTNYLATAFDPRNPIGTAAADIGGRRNVDLLRNGLKLPSIIRGNLGIDVQLAKLDSMVTVEFVGTTNRDSLFWRNLNIQPLIVTAASGPARGADGRQRFNGAAGGAGALNTAFGNVLQVSNVDDGSAQYLSLGFDRPMQNNWSFSASYTRGKATNAHSSGQATGLNSWQRNAVFNQNALETHRSDNEIRDRVRTTVTRAFTTLRDWKASVSLTYEGRSGMPFSWVYSNDLNGDGIAGNDIAYIPTGLTDPIMDFSQLPAAQAQAYVDFMSRMGLNKYSGRTVPANAETQPWINRLDLHVSQKIPLPGFGGISKLLPAKSELEVFADWVNFGAVISKKLFGYYEKLPDINGIFGRRFVGNASYGPDGRIRPVVNTAADAPTVDNDFSRWQFQVGARLRF